MIKLFNVFNYFQIGVRTFQQFDIMLTPSINLIYFPQKDVQVGINLRVEHVTIIL